MLLYWGLEPPEIKDSIGFLPVWPFPSADGGGAAPFPPAKPLWGVAVPLRGGARTLLRRPLRRCWGRHLGPARAGLGASFWGGC